MNNPIPGKVHFFAGKQTCKNGPTNSLTCATTNEETDQGSSAIPNVLNREWNESISTQNAR